MVNFRFSHLLPYWLLRGAFLLLLNITTSYEHSLLLLLPTVFKCHFIWGYVYYPIHYIEVYFPLNRISGVLLLLVDVLNLGVSLNSLVCSSY